ncbi:hypothetical protein SAMN05660489_04574 [Pseudomonas sp. LAMO17WK12:I10]|uniref:hypothetical protein n=1 Tax=unclassified Pseudomonas TaxID=196821 RepID=UPI000BD6D69A|nr:MULTISPECIES: hypothetical protein [unclassified Pseudomonas]PXX59548.1 hypothetical protein H160_04669 [Pseudomonas sp. LAMO17WK12:I9]SNY46829.1 hypothetical protein SAMN05660489_04574 [Pseudomonas sp. LAMO17WK12:I10]
MIAKLFVTIGIIFYAVVVPVLEINQTHVFNPAWEPHARLHEVWQLWLVWLKSNLRLSSLLTVFVTGGFLAAYGLQQSYGGSMVLTDGSEKLILGINLGLFAYTLAILLAAIAVVIDRRKRPARL